MRAFTSLISFAMFLVVKGYRYQVFHVRQYGYHAALAIAIGRVLRKLVVIKTTCTFTEGIATALEESYRFSRPMMAPHRRVSACIAISTDAAREAAQFGIPQERIHLIPNGVDVDEFRPATDAEKGQLRAQLGLRRPLVVLYTGRLVAFKNLGGLMESWSAIHGDVDAVLVMIGDGALRTTLEERCNGLGLESSVRSAGRQSDVLRWHQAADVFVLLSHYEGLVHCMSGLSRDRRTGLLTTFA